MTCAKSILPAFVLLGIARVASPEACAPATHSEKIGGGTIVYDVAGANGPATANPRAVSAFFVCDGGKTIFASFTNGPKASVTLSLSDGREMVLPQAMSASGARYANRDESFVFWNKGNTAFIEESGKATYSRCAVKQ